MESARPHIGTFDDGEVGDDETPGEAMWRYARRRPARGGYHAFAPVRPGDRGRDFGDHDELGASLRIFDKRLAHLQGIVARLRQRLQRRLWRSGIAPGSSYRGRHIDPARLSRVVTDPCHRRPSCMRGSDLRDTVVTLWTFRLDARLDQVATTCADISHARSSAAASRSSSQAPRPAPGRACSRARRGRRGQAGKSGRLNDLRHIITRSGRST